MRGEHDRPCRTQSRRRCWVGNTAKDRSQNRNDQNQRREHHPQQFVLRHPHHSNPTAINGEGKRKGEVDPRCTRTGRGRDEQHIHRKGQGHANPTDQQRTRVLIRRNTACCGQDQCQDKKDCRHARPDRCRIGNRSLASRNHFLFGQFAGFTCCT